MTRHMAILTAALALYWPASGFAQGGNASPGGTSPAAGANPAVAPTPQPAAVGQANPAVNKASPNPQSGQPQGQAVLPNGNVPGQPPQSAGVAPGPANVAGGVGNAAASGPNQWRYKWHQGRWWYWTPAKNWVVYLNNAWRPYTPGMFDSGYFGSANSGTYYTPYSGYPYGYSYRAYPYYGSYGYGYVPSNGLGASRYYSGYRGFGGYNGFGNRGGVSIGIGGGFF